MPGMSGAPLFPRTRQTRGYCSPVSRAGMTELRAQEANPNPLQRRRGAKPSWVHPAFTPPHLMGLIRGPASAISALACLPAHPRVPGAADRRPTPASGVPGPPAASSPTSVFSETGAGACGALMLDAHPFVKPQYSRAEVLCKWDGSAVTGPPNREAPFGWHRDPRSSPPLPARLQFPVRIVKFGKSTHPLNTGNSPFSQWGWVFC